MIKMEGRIQPFVHLKCINHFRLWSGFYHHVMLYVDNRFSEELSAFTRRVK